VSSVVADRAVSLSTGSGAEIAGSVAVFCCSSAGELDVLLPLFKIAGVSDFRIVTLKQQIAAKIADDGFYRALLDGMVEDRSLSMVRPGKVGRWLQFIGNAWRAYREFGDRDLLFFEYGRSGREKNVLLALLLLFGRANRIRFHPHGHAVTADSSYAPERWPPLTRYCVARGAKLIRLGGRVPARHFLNVDYPILHPKWRAFVEAAVPQRYANHVVILSRDVHPQYLLEENRSTMLRDVVQVCSEHFPGSPIVIKAHPRESFPARTIDICGRAVEVTYENTYSVVRGAVLAVSFWTSAFFQCLALGVPVVEYHIPHEGFRSEYPDGSLHAPFIPTFTSRPALASHVAALAQRARSQLR
jgi:hypothetical protein